VAAVRTGRGGRAKLDQSGQNQRRPKPRQSGANTKISGPGC